MKQIITSAAGASYPLMGAIYNNLQWNGDGVITEANMNHPWSVAGNFNNLKVGLPIPPGSGVTITVVLLVNGSPSTLTVNIVHPATDASDTTHSVTVAPGDKVSFRRTASGGNPAAGAYHRVHVEFDSDNAGEQGYGHHSFGAGGRANGLTIYDSLLSPSLNGTHNDDDLGEEDSYQDVVAINGAITRFDIMGRKSSYAALDSGDSLEFAIYKNNIRQDGSGGTVDTRVTATNASPDGFWTGTLPFAVGDLLRWGAVCQGLASTGLRVATSIRFVATTDGEFMLTMNGEPAAGSEPADGRFGGMWADGWSSVAFGGEAASQVCGGPTTFYLHDIKTNPYGTSAPDLYTIFGRLNGATPSPTVVKSSVDIGFILRVTVRCSTTVGSGSFMTITNSDLWCLMLSLIAMRDGSISFGDKVTVTAARAIAFSVDGNTNVHSESGVVKIFGNLDVTGGVDAPASTSFSSALDGLGT